MTTATPDGQPPLRWLTSRSAAIAVALFCCAGAAYLVVAQREAADVQHARDLARNGDFTGAARAARGIGGASATPARAVEAEALARAGVGAAADQAFARAIRLDPTSWTLRRDWAIALLAEGQRRPARRQIEIAHSLNPGMTLPAGFYFR